MLGNASAREWGALGERVASHPATEHDVLDRLQRRANSGQTVLKRRPTPTPPPATLFLGIISGDVKRWHRPAPTHPTLGPPCPAPRRAAPFPAPPRAAADGCCPCLRAGRRIIRCTWGRELMRLGPAVTLTFLIGLRQPDRLAADVHEVNVAERVPVRELDSPHPHTRRRACTRTLDRSLA